MTWFTRSGRFPRSLEDGYSRVMQVQIHINGSSVPAATRGGLGSYGTDRQRHARHAPVSDAHLAKKSVVYHFIQQELCLARWVCLVFSGGFALCGLFLRKSYEFASNGVSDCGIFGPMWNSVRFRSRPLSAGEVPLGWHGKYLSGFANGFVRRMLA